MLFFVQNPKQQYLAESIARVRGWRLGLIVWQQFSDGEWYLLLKNKVSRQIVWVLGDSRPPGDNLVKLLLLISALKENGAKEINLILPYIAYSRQDRVDQTGAPVSGKAILQAILSVGVNKIFTVDIHSDLLKRKFKKKLINIESYPLLAKSLHKLRGPAVAVSPDRGAIKRARQLAKILGLEFVWLEKVRPTKQTAKIIKLHGQVNNKQVIIVDDMIETGGTILAAARMLKDKGAKKIYVAVTHGVLVKDSPKKLQSGPFERVFITNTLNIENWQKFPNLKIIDASRLIAENLK